MGRACTRAANILFFTGLRCFVIVQGPVLLVHPEIWVFSWMLTMSKHTSAGYIGLGSSETQF